MLQNDTSMTTFSTNQHILRSPALLYPQCEAIQCISWNFLSYIRDSDWFSAESPTIVNKFCNVLCSCVSWEKKLSDINTIDQHRRIQSTSALMLIKICVITCFASVVVWVLCKVCLNIEEAARKRKAKEKEKKTTINKVCRLFTYILAISIVIGVKRLYN